MGQTARQIETHIENTREDLGSNLAELENKVKTAMDWKQHFEDNPMMILGAAFGGGILLASILGGRESRRRGQRYASPAGDPEPHTGSDTQRYKALETWDNVKGALIGVAATRFKDFVGKLIPDFHEQYRETEAEAKGQPPEAV